jgi:uncharacterized membrane protein YuzA (DUF378 family)
MSCKSPLAAISCILLVIGGLNWGLVGLGMLIGQPLNVVQLLLGQWPVVEAIVYLLVGISAIIHVIIYGTVGCKCGCKCGTEKK